MKAVSNLTISSKAEFMQPFTPSQGCFDWCSVQHIVHFNNVSVWSILIIGVAYVALSAIPYFEESEKLQDYAYTLVTFARLSLITFLFYYFVYIRWGLL